MVGKAQLQNVGGRDVQAHAATTAALFQVAA